MSDETKRPLTARELYQRGIERNQWNKPFDQDATASPATSAPDPESERDAAELRRRIAQEQREAREYQAELDRLSEERDAERRRLAQASRPAWAEEASPVPATAEPVDPMSPEAVAAREAALDRLFQRTWSFGRG